MEVLGSWILENEKPVGKTKVTGKLVYQVRCMNCDSTRHIQQRYLNEWRRNLRQATCGRCRQHSKGFRRITIEARAIKLARQMLMLMIEGMDYDDASQTVIFRERINAPSMANSACAEQLPNQAKLATGRKTTQ